MATQHLYYSLQDRRFVSEEDALRIVRAEIINGNLHAMTDRVIEYSFPGLHGETKLAKISVIVE